MKWQWYKDERRVGLEQLGGPAGLKNQELGLEEKAGPEEMGEEKRK